MYKSPIEVLIEEFNKKIVKKQDADIYQAVLDCDIKVDKDELIRALEYDRGQYEKGFRDGVASVTDNNVGGKWIPVSERLPEPMEWVLCVCRADFITVLRYDHIMDDWDATMSNRCYAKEFVKYWMPLPEPPEEDEK